MAKAPVPNDIVSDVSPRPPFLTTKLYLPPVRTNLVLRPHLTQRLNKGLTCKLTLISAPAGFGKTILLSEWIPNSPCCVIWVSLDAGDNDPVRFWTYCMAALQMLQSDLGKSALALLQSPQSPPLELILANMLNEIADFPQKFALVLDDFHVIENPTLYDNLVFLLDNLPSTMHLILTSRTDPPVPLARLRARRQLNEIRAADLRFTHDEAATFLNEIMGLNLSVKDVAALETRTEGWIAGLQLAALSMQGRQDLTGFIQTFTGSHGYIVDYLLEEVLQRQPEDVQSFLLQTSVLERLCGPLCNAVTGLADSQAMLEKLQHSNLFITPLDDERRWYRYHHLFADLLRAHLKQADPNSAPELHRRASSWYEQNRLVAEAVPHALAAGDSKLATRLIRPLARPMQSRGEMRTVMDWLTALPEDELRLHPQLGLIFAWGLATTGQLPMAKRWLQDVEQHLTALDDHDKLLGEMTVILARIALIQGEFPRVLELARQAIAYLPEDQLSLRALNYISLGSACIALGHLNTASQSFAQASAFYQALGQPIQALLPLRQLARVQLAQGRLNQLDQTTQVAIQLAAESETPSPLKGYNYMSLGELWYERNNLTAANHYFTEGLALVEPGGTSDVLNLMNLADGYLGLTRLKLTQGDSQGVLELTRRLEPVWAQLARAIQRRSGAEDVSPSNQETEPSKLRYGVSHIYLDLIAACRVRLWLSQGNLDAASQWVQTREWSMEGEIRYVEEVRYITLARVLIAQGEYERALAFLARLLEPIEAVGRMGRVIELLALRALALRAHGQESEALIALERALVLAEPEGYIRTFVDEGPPMAALLREAHTRAIRPAYVAQLLTAFPAFELPLLDASRGLGDGAIQNRKSKIQNLVEPLSRRELEILALMAQGLTNPEIAQHIFISAQTVKVHTRNIYSKLGVNSRRQAVAKARTLGLLV